MALAEARARARQLDVRLAGAGPRWVQNAAVVFAAGAWLCLGGLWVVAPEGMVLCLVTAAVSTSLGAFCSVLLRRPIWHILGYGSLAALGLNLIVVEIAYGWAFVWPLWLIVLAYGHVAAVWLASMLVLTNWAHWSARRRLGAVVLVGLLAVGVALFELTLRSSGGLLVLLPGLVLAAAATAAAATLRRRQPSSLPWWSPPAGLVVVLVSGWASTVWLLGEAGSNAALRIDAIQTGLTIGLLAGGGFALLVAVYGRRTVAAGAAPADPAVELLSTAAGQLAQDRAAVRLAGLKLLERLGREHPQHRQAVLDLIGGHLRTRTTGAKGGDLSAEERSVRLAAQNALSRVLQAGVPTGWRVVAEPLSDGTTFRLVNDTDAAAHSVGKAVQPAPGA